MRDDPETENGRCGARDYSGTRRALPLILADIGHEHVFAGWFDARWARVIVGGEIKKGARGLSWRHFDRFLVSGFSFFCFFVLANDLEPFRSGIPKLE